MQEKFESNGYSAAHLIVDTKAFYIPHTRQRGYVKGEEAREERERERGEEEGRGERGEERCEGGENRGRRRSEYMKYKLARRRIFSSGDGGDGQR